MSKFSQKLRQLRERDNLTQKELAQRLEISASAVSMYERDEREPDFEMLEAIADCFNVPLSTMIDNDLPPTSTSESVLNEAWFSLKSDMETNGIHPNDIRQIMEIVIEQRRRNDKS